MSEASDCDSQLRSLLTSLGLKEQSDLAAFCNKTSLNVSVRTFKVLLNVVSILNYQEKYDVAYRIVKILFTKHALASPTMGTSIAVSLLLVEVALNCHYRERTEEDYLNCVGEAFKLLDRAYEMLTSNVKDKATLLSRTISADSTIGVDFTEAACVILFCHTAFYKSKVCFALHDNVTAKQIINNGLEIIWKYLQFIMSESPNIWIDHSSVATATATTSKAPQQQPFPSLTDYLNVPETEPNGSQGTKVVLSNLSIAAISSKICHICKMGTSLNARAEYLSGNFVGAKAICAQLRILESLPNTIEDRRIALFNNEACISLHLREVHSATAQISRSIEDICENFSKVSVPRYLPPLKSNLDTSPGSEKPLNVLADASIVGVLYNAGLIYLKMSQPLDAFLYFEKVTNASFTSTKTIADQPYPWIRLAECCLQQDVLQLSVAKSGTLDQPFFQVVSVSKGRSRRLQIVSNPQKSSTSLSSTTATSTGIGLIGQSEDVSSRCTLAAAVIYLKKSLQVIRELKEVQIKKSSTGESNLRDKELLRLSNLENNSLLRITYVYLKLSDPVNALEYVQRLVDQINNEEFSQFRYSTYNYYIEVLCQLGRHEKAGAFLKSQFEVHFSDNVIANSYMSSELFRSHGVAPSKLFVSQSKLPPNVAMMSLQVNKAIVLILRGLYGGAVTILEAIVRTNPAYMPAVRCLMYVYIRQGKTKQTLNVLNISLKAKI